MSILKSLAVCCSFAALVAASPVALVEKAVGARHRIQQVYGGVRAIHPLAELAKARARSGHKVVGVEKRQTTGTSPAIPIKYDNVYISKFNIENTTVNVHFDTGSSDLWLFSSQQSADQLVGHNHIPCNSTPKVAGELWSVQYGDGSTAQGNIELVTVTTGDITVTKQAVECATSVSNSFVAATYQDGIVGLAFKKLNRASPKKVNPFFENLRPHLASPVFAANLGHKKAGSYDFGYIDSNAYTGSISYVPVAPGSGRWNVSSNGYSIGNGAFVPVPNYYITPDTGTSLVLIPQDQVTAYYGSVPGGAFDSTHDLWYLPCKGKGPDFHIYFGGAKFRIPIEYIRYAPFGGGDCIGGIQPTTGEYLLGDVALSGMYVVYSPTVPEIGFAQQPSLPK